MFQNKMQKPLTDIGCRQSMEMMRTLEKKRKKSSLSLAAPTTSEMSRCNVQLARSGTLVVSAMTWWRIMSCLANTQSICFACFASTHRRRLTLAPSVGSLPPPTTAASASYGAMMLTSTFTTVMIVVSVGLDMAWRRTSSTVK